MRKYVDPLLSLVVIFPVVGSQIIFPGELRTGTLSSSFAPSEASVNQETPIITSALVSTSPERSETSFVEVSSFRVGIPGAVAPSSMSSRTEPQMLMPSQFGPIPSTTSTQTTFSTVPPSSSPLGGIQQTLPRSTPTPISLTASIPSTFDPVQQVTISSSTATNSRAQQSSFQGDNNFQGSTRLIQSVGATVLDETDSFQQPLTSQGTFSVTPTPASTSTVISSTSSPSGIAIQAAEEVSSSASFPDVNDQMIIDAMNDLGESSDNNDPRDRDQCFTPLRETGMCVPLRDCSGYTVLRGQVRDSVVASYLKGRICRLLPRSLLFCCPFADPILPIGSR